MKNRKLLRLTFAGLATVLTSGLIFGIFQKLEYKEALEERKKKLPLLPLITYDSLQFNIEQISQQPTVLIYFNTECHHCQYEAKEILNNIEGLKEINFIFISSEPLSMIKKFAIENKLDTISTISFTQINPSEVYTYFGSVTIPSLFIYSRDGILVKAFKGETSIYNVVKYLK